MFFHTQNFSRRKFRLGNVLERQKKFPRLGRHLSYFNNLFPALFDHFVVLYSCMSDCHGKKKRQNTSPPPGREIFCWPRWIGNSTRRYCYRDATPTNVFCKDMKGAIEVSYVCMVHFQMVFQKFNFFHWSCLCIKDFGSLFSLLNYMGSPQSKTKLLCVESKF